MNQFFIGLCERVNYHLNNLLSTDRLIYLIAGKTLTLIITLLLCAFMSELISRSKLAVILGR